MFRTLPIILLVALGFPAGRLSGGAATPNPGLRNFYPAPDVPVVDVAADVIVYGGTSGGVVAAVQAVRMGKSAALVVFGPPYDDVTGLPVMFLRLVLQD